MDLKNLQKKLFERKLGIMEYFEVGFSAFKVLLKENKFLMFFSFLITFFCLALITVVQILKFSLEIIGLDVDLLIGLAVMGILSLVVNVISMFFKGYFFRKVAFKLEDNKSDLKLSELFIKVVILLGIYLVLGILAFFADDVLLGVFNFLIIVVTIWALLYIEGYYIRSFGLKKSLEYSLELSKGNRFRVIVPIIFATMITVLEIILFIFILKDEPEMMSSLSIFIFLVFLFTVTIIAMYIEILNIVIFLNVENDYLKNEGKHSEFNLSNKQKNDEVLNNELKNENYDRK